jgi:hypothetical protein
MTAQAAESLIYKGTEYFMFTEPLGGYLDHHPSIQFESYSTACWRGYYGSWEVKGTHELGYGLYLIELSGYLPNQEKVGLEYLFPNSPEGVFAHWFNGEIRCPFGELLNYVHMGYASTYQNDLILEFRRGLLISERIVDNSQSPRDEE